jgi:hypothetical protein
MSRPRPRAIWKARPSSWGADCGQLAAKLNGEVDLSDVEFARFQLLLGEHRAIKVSRAGATSPNFTPTDR